ncbi:MAG: hypothetical protein ACSLE0_04685 [Chitinophagaceae bacterium]
MPDMPFKKIIKKIASRAFKKELNRTGFIAASYQQLAESEHKNWTIPNATYEGIVFSKDRAMQLHALISSYFANTKNPVKLNILYTTSHKGHAESYETLKNLFVHYQITFIKENSFKADLENLLGNISATGVFFMTDDGMFIDSFDLNEVIIYNPFRIIPSLIKGLDLTYCYIHDKKQKLPTFLNPEGLPLAPDMKCWDWGKAETTSDWAYPLSLDVTFYNKKEIQILIGNITYQGPNSLETALHQNYSPIFLQRKGVCYDKAKYVNIVCNTVNTEHLNRNTGLHTTEELLKKWEEGFRIRYEDFYGKNCLDVEQSSFNFIKR